MTDYFDRYETRVFWIYTVAKWISCAALFAVVAWIAF